MARINNAHLEYIKGWKRTVDVQYAALKHARAAGEALLAVKTMTLHGEKMIRHGEWLPWLKKNCPKVGERQAQRYMRIAENWEELKALKPKIKSDTETDLLPSIRDALEYLTEPKTETEPKKPVTSVREDKPAILPSRKPKSVPVSDLPPSNAQHIGVEIGDGNTVFTPPKIAALSNRSASNGSSHQESAKLLVDGIKSLAAINIPHPAPSKFFFADLRSQIAGRVSIDDLRKARDLLDAVMMLEREGDDA